jgi:hypothetical protein
VAPRLWETKGVAPLITAGFRLNSTRQAIRAIGGRATFGSGRV